MSYLKITFAYQNSWSHKCKTRVFHSTKWETWRQHQQIIDLPNIWPHQLFSCLQHCLCLPLLNFENTNNTQFGFFFNQGCTHIFKSALVSSYTAHKENLSTVYKLQSSGKDQNVCKLESGMLSIFICEQVYKL